MKKILVLLLLFPVLVFSQGEAKTDINWISLNAAKEHAKKYNKNILIFFYR